MVRRTREDKAIDLRILAETRIDVGPVQAAARVRMLGVWKPRRHVLAVTDQHLFWIQIRRRWPLELGAVGYDLPIEGTKITTKQTNGTDMYRIEFSRPFDHVLQRGKLYGPGADHLAGHLAAREFALS